MFGLNSQVAPNVCVNKCRENRSSCDIYHRQALLNVVISRLSREIASFETGRFEHEFNSAPPIPIERRQTQDAASVCDGQLSGDDRQLNLVLPLSIGR
jgi:hypothetical protein